MEPFTAPPITAIQPEQGFTPPGLHEIQPEKSGLLSDIADTAKQFWNKINPVKQAQGVVQAVAHPIATVQGYGDTNSKIGDSASQAFKAGDYGQAARHALSYFLQVVPGLGSALDEAGNKGEKGDVKGMIADTAAIAAGLAQAKFAGPVAEAVTSKVAGAGQAVARGTMQSALKPGVADAPTMADVHGVVRTALENELPATEAGASKLQGLIADYGQKVKAVVDAKAQTGATVDPNAVAQRLSQVDTTQVLPEKDIATVNKAKEAFLARKGAAPGTVPAPTGLVNAQGQPIMTAGTPATPAQPVPFDVAQAEKQGTYRQNAAKYGELTQAQIESEKALARGYKEEMEKQAPELAGLNAKESDFIGLQSVLERAVRRAGNRDIIGLPGAVEVGTGAAAGGAPGAALGITARILDFPGLKSRLAIAINKASQKTGTALSVAESTAKAGAVLGAIAAQQPEVANATQ